MSNATPLVISAFMMEGLCFPGKQDPIYNDILAAYSRIGGAIELVHDMLQHVEYIELLEQSYAERIDTEYPGVFDYEVSSPFGTWFGRFVFEHEAAPTQEEAQAKALELVNSFFKVAP